MSIRPTPLTVAMACALLFTPWASSAGMQAVTLTAPFGAPGGDFGRAVALDGDSLVVSGYEFDDAGVPFGAVIAYEPSEDSWEPVASLRSDRPRDHFGIDLALDGDTLAVGAPGHCEGATGDGEDSNGRLYLYERAGGGWAQDQILERGPCVSFATSIDLAGDVLVASSYQDEGSPSSVFVYEHDGSGWVLSTALRPPAGHQGFGDYGAATDGTFVVVGSARAADGGHALIYANDGSGWDQIAELGAPPGSDASAFGSSVAARDGMVVVGGAPDGGPAETSGAAYVYSVQGWTLTAELTAPDPKPDERFGRSIAIEGDRIAISTTSVPASEGFDAGRVIEFARGPGGWAHHETLTPSEAVSFDTSGNGLDIDGSSVIAGAPAEETSCGQSAGAVYLFGESGAATPEEVLGQCGVPPHRLGPRTRVTSSYAVTTPSLVKPITGDAVGWSAPVTAVEVWLTDVGGRFGGRYWADLTCKDLVCTWSVSVPPNSVLPATAQVYLVTAQAQDTSANTGPPSEPEPVLVVGHR